MKAVLFCILQLVVSGEHGHHGAHVEVIARDLDLGLVMDLAVKDIQHIPIHALVEVALVCEFTLLLETVFN